MTGQVGVLFGLRTVKKVPYPETECRPCKADRARERRSRERLAKAS